jgi:hypothetical protein
MIDNATDNLITFCRRPKRAMSWTALEDGPNGPNQNDKPRKLTSKEIQYIVSHLPQAPSADQESAILNRKSVMQVLADSLKSLELCPSAIPDLIKVIVDQHTKSLITPGTPIGLTAAEAIGATSTQMTLNSVAPWEIVLFIDDHGFQVTEIGAWIDQMLKINETKIQHIPENRTEYLHLEHTVRMLTPSSSGDIKWNEVTGVTRHLPTGNLVQVTTKSGRSVTVTQSKSLLVYENGEFIHRNGSDVKVGDRMPVMYKIPQPPGKGYLNVETTEGIIRELTRLRDRSHMSITDMQNASNSRIILTQTNAYPVEMIAYMCARLGIFCEIKRSTVWVVDIDRWNQLVQESSLENSGSCYDRVNDVVLDPIVKIESIPACEFVYDLTIPETTNFSLWNGLGVADTFHQSGSSKSASFGIESLKNIIYASKNPKNNSCTVHFKNKQISFEEVLDYRRVIVGSTVKDFIVSYEIKDASLLSREWWHDINPSKSMPATGKVMRLHLAIPEMYKHRVSISDIARILELEVPPSISTLYGPNADAIIDVVPQKDVLAATLSKLITGVIPDNMLEQTFLENIVWTNFEKIRVKGIAGITSLIPLVRPLWSVVLVERKLVDEDLDTDLIREKLSQYLGQAWVIALNPGIMKETGLTAGNVGYLCEKSGINVLHMTDDQVIVSMPLDINGSPKSHIDTLVARDKENRLDEIKRLTDEMMEETKDPRYSNEERRAIRRSPITVPRTDLLIANEFVYAETEGSNLLEIMALPEVDTVRTICSNMHTITEVLGCEAALLFITKSLVETNSNTGAYVHPTHLKLVAEFIMSRGYPYGANYMGISRQPGGHLSLATLERAGSVFAKSALHGRREDLRNVSAAIAVGSRIAIGNGSFDIGQDIEIDGKPHRVFNDELFTALKQDDLTKNEMADYLTESVEDLGRNAINNTSVEQNFDLHGDEESTSLLGMFSSSIIADLNVIRPINAIAPKSVFRKTLPETTAVLSDVDPNVADELTGVLDEIANLDITPVEIASPPQPIMEIKSSALVMDNTETVPVGIPFSQDFEEMMQEYQRETSRSNLALNVPLPSIQPRSIPGLEGQNIGVSLLEGRQAQLAGLTIIQPSQ